MNKENAMNKENTSISEFRNEVLADFKSYANRLLSYNNDIGININPRKVSYISDKIATYGDHVNLVSNIIYLIKSNYESLRGESSQENDVCPISAYKFIEKHLSKLEDEHTNIPVNTILSRMLTHGIVSGLPNLVTIEAEMYQKLEVLVNILKETIAIGDTI